jgi:hypothetical protein
MQFLRRVLNRLLRPLIAKQDLLLQRLDDVAGSLERTLKASWHDHNTRSEDLKVMLESEHRLAADAAEVVVAGLHAMRADVDALTEWGSEASLARLRSGELGAVDAMVAEAINCANGPGGFADRAGLWLRPAVQVRWAPGRASVTDVTARIVAVPFVLRAVAALPPRSNVLDLANGDLSLDLSIAALGHQVSIADRERLPLDHPRLAMFQLGIDDGKEQFDAVFAVATEDGAIRGGRAFDTLSSAEVRNLVRPGGLLALAVAVSDDAPGGDGVLREPDIAAAVPGWELVECAFARRRDQLLWDLEASGEGRSDEPRVALVAARRTD